MRGAIQRPTILVMPAKAGIHRQQRRSMRSLCLYILASQPQGTLYVGVTSDLIRRVWEHRHGNIDGFTKTYGVKKLVFLETHETMPDAILREKQVKKWRRAWKLELIERTNPGWRDLYDEIVGAAGGFPLARE